MRIIGTTKNTEIGVGGGMPTKRKKGEAQLRIGEGRRSLR